MSAMTKLIEAREQRNRRCPLVNGDGFSRRRAFLRAGTGSLFSSLAALSSFQSSSKKARGESTASLGKAKRCILVYLLGGPPHLDMWDMKPNAPAEIRGPFRPIATNVPGMEFCEHLPGLARRANRLAVVRSVSYPNNDHPYMIYYTLTGRVSPTPLGANTVLPPSRTDHPHMGSVIAKYQGARHGVPAYVAIPEVRVRMQAVPVSGGGRAGFLGAPYDPLAINDDPSVPIPNLRLAADVSHSRFQGRQALLAMLEGSGPVSKRMEDYGEYRQSASELLGGDAARELFTLDREPASLRERYGNGRFGQSMLLARRLVERGVRFAAIHFNYMSKCDGWDTHAKNFECLRGDLLPTLDQGMSALLDDLADRGMLDDTLVVAMGEFGRSPIINREGGRDHWGNCGSVVFAGGGVQGGRHVGASDRHGAYPEDRPVSPTDVVATIYHAMGLPADAMMYDALQGRPMPLVEGTALRELF
ncbi:MAG: DUF1501 domain-containing protein [Planctomycetota bacterium]